MKSTCTGRALAASVLFASLLAGCSSYPWQRGESGPGSSSTQAGTESGASATRFDCAQFQQLESRRTPSTQQELVDQNLSGMSPEERERHMKMMREKCGSRGSPADSKY
jgi:predicted component of type VI protein secretion system